MKQYEKFGFVFDHIYGFEILEVYETLLPEEYISSYHWINVGVSAKEGDKLNPLHSIVKKFDEDDFVVVKLDIDTSSVKVPLVRELLEDKDGVYSKIVDQFYFEHHVHLGELAGAWKSSIVEMDRWSVNDGYILTLLLFLKVKLSFQCLCVGIGSKDFGLGSISCTSQHHEQFASFIILKLLNNLNNHHEGPRLDDNICCGGASILPADFSDICIRGAISSILC